MKTSLSVKFTPSQKEDGIGRIYFQIIHKRVVRQLNPNISCKNSNWNGGNVIPFTNDADANEKINQSIDLAKRVIDTLDAKKIEYSCDDVVRLFNDDRNNLINYINTLSERLKKCGKLSTADNYKALSNRICEFAGNNYTTIYDIDSDFVESFEAFLLGKGVKRNTSSFYIRNLRAVWNKAIDNGILPPTYINPFKHVYKGIDVTKKRAISAEDIKKIKSINLKSDKKLEFARDLFMFSFYTRGMSFVDIVSLRKDNIQNDVISYQRRKTGKLMSIKVEKEIKRILEKYIIQERDYIFPIATCRQDEYVKGKTMLSYVNQSLKKIAMYCNIDATLTMYVARHSWASIAQNVANVPLSVISKGMGHSSEKVTQVYLASFGNKDIDKANSNIMSLI